MYTFTVHEYRNSRSSSNTALDKGYRLLNSLVLPETQWVDVRNEPFSYAQSSNSYMFRVQPPVIGRNTADSLKEWNAPCTEDELFSLESLEDFAGTDFQSLLVGKSTEPLLQQSSLPSPLPAQTDSLDNDSLYGSLLQSQSSSVVNNENQLIKPCIPEQYSIIPGFSVPPESRTHQPSNPGGLSQPVIPGFDLDEPLKVVTLTESERNMSAVGSAIPNKRRLSQEPFVANKRKPIFGSLYDVIPQPHMHPSPFLASQACLSGSAYARPPLWTKLPSPCDDARVAWLIPVRGTLPWEGSTPAVLENAAVNSDARISWTTATLIQFWDFALDLRQSATFGSLGVAFHFANARALPFARPPSPAPALQDPRAALPSVDFIKIYHDAYQRLYLRSALDEWTFRTDEEGRESKPLSGARLVLVDEVSQAILIV